MKTISYETARERAGRGAALLDERSPGWWRHLYPEGINMMFGDQCVVGALNPDVGYYAMLEELGVLDEGECTEGTIVWYGFDVADDEFSADVENPAARESYARLTDVWRVLVAGRLIEAGLR